MAEAIRDDGELRQRALRRLSVAVILVLAAVGILTYLSYYKPAKVVTKPVPETLPPPPPPIINGPEPVQPAPLPEAATGTPPSPAAAPPQPPGTAPAPQPEPPPPPVVNAKPLPPPGPGPKKTAPSSPKAETAKTSTPAQATPTPNLETSKAPEAPAAPKAAPAAPRAAPTTAPTGYVVQFGVFGNPENALQLVQKLKQAGIDAHTETHVQLPTFKTRAEAEAALGRMREKGIPATIVAR